MNFDFDEDQQEIKRTARDLLGSRSTWSSVRAHAESHDDDDALWSELRDLGWPGIAVSETYGGQGLGLVELAILAEELGFALAPTPLLGTALAALAIEHGGSEEQRERLLPGLASGETTGALGPAGGLVGDAVGAGVVVLVDGQGAAVVADPQVEPIDAIDPTRRYGRIGPHPPASEPLGGDAAAAVDRAAIVVAAELVGISQRALEMSVEYVKDRKQFGTPVGAYQAVAHRCAQMLRDTESARAATYFAAWAADAEPERLPEAASLAKASASDGGRETTSSAIQAHGGIGFTWEADVHWLYKRAQMDAVLLGGGSFHRARLARLLADRARDVEEADPAPMPAVATPAPAP